MNVIQVQNEPTSATCPHCGADVATDQRYCLACGRPCSPVRLAFLDVLQAESQGRAPGAIVSAPAGYALAAAPDEGVARLGRYSGLFGLIAVLLLTGVIGLLVGHWISGGGGSNKPAVYKIEGLSGTAAPAAEAATSSEGAATGSAATGSAAAGRAAAGTAKKAASAKKAAGTAAKKPETVSEAKETKEAKLPAAVKPSKATQEKLSKLTGKAYEKEIEKEVKGPEPIETQ